jgi:hypothetical protein
MRGLSDSRSEPEIEIELARRLITGNAEAFDRSVEQFQMKIFRYSWLMYGQRDDAEVRIR